MVAEANVESVERKCHSEQGSRDHAALIIGTQHSDTQHTGPGWQTQYLPRMLGVTGSGSAVGG